jgi:hypothetical protein
MAHDQSHSRTTSVIASSSKRGKGGNGLLPAASRNLPLFAFLTYCILPAMWMVTAMTKDIGQLFSTFGLWFAS